MTDYEVAAGGADRKVKFSTRALPPLPPKLKGNWKFANISLFLYIKISIHFATGTARTESPATTELNPATEESNEDRDEKKDVQKTMDFAANIEKVKEVTKTN